MWYIWKAETLVDSKSPTVFMCDDVRAHRHTQTHTFMSGGGDVHSELKLPAHMVRREATTQAVADWLITAHTHTQARVKIHYQITHRHKQSKCWIPKFSVHVQWVWTCDHDKLSSCAHTLEYMMSSVVDQYQINACTMSWLGCIDWYWLHYVESKCWRSDDCACVSSSGIPSLCLIINTGYMQEFWR